MTDALSAATNALGSPQTRAFLRIIREGESNQNDDAYTLINGGDHFVAPPWRHPTDNVPTTQGGKAAGAYQFLGTTWHACDTALGLGGDFSPPNQDAAACHLIIGRGALPYVLSGDLGAAVAKLRDEWVSLQTMSAATRQATFLQYGGTSAGEAPGAATPAGAPAVPSDAFTAPGSPQSLKDASMPLNANVQTALQFLPSILSLVPGLGTIAGLANLVIGAIPTQGAAGGSLHGSDYIGLAKTVVDTFTKAIPQAVNEQQAVQLAQADPAIAATAAHAVLTQPDVAAELAAIAPTLDKIATYDAATNAAVIVGRESALHAQQGAQAETVQLVVKNVFGQSWLMVIGITVMLIGAMVCKGIWPEIPDYVPMLVGIVGMVFGAVIAEMKAITAFFFDGTPASNATAVARDAIETAVAKKP